MTSRFGLRAVGEVGLVAQLRYPVMGEVDLSNASELEADLMALVKGDGTDSLVVDCANLIFIDAVGIQALIKVCVAVERTGGSFCLVDVPARQRRLLEILDLNETLHVGSSAQPRREARSA